MIVGYYGYGNMGDEILMEQSVSIMRKLGFSSVRVLYPKRIETFVERWNPIKVLHEVSKSDIVVFGGGGLLQDETSLRSFMYYHFLAYFAAKIGKKVLFLGCGFGPLKKKVSRFLMAKLASMKKVYFFPRDPVSLRYLSTLSENVHEGTDLAIGYLMRFERGDRRDTVLISPRSKRNWRKIADFLRSMGFKVEFLIADPVDMRYVPPGEMVTMGLPILKISSSSLVLSERFHPALAAAIFDVPFVSIGKKSSRFFSKYTKTSPSILENPSDLDIMYAVQRVLRDPLAISGELIEDYESMLKRLEAMDL